MHSYKNHTILITVSFFTILFSQTMQGQEVVKFNNASMNLDRRWEQAIDKIDDESVWIGYSIKRLMGERCYIGSSNTEDSRPSLQDVISGKAKIQSMEKRGHDERHFHMSDGDEIEKEMKDVGILIQINKKRTEIIREVDLSNLSLPFDLSEKSLFWLGDAEYDESIDLLKKLYNQVEDTEIKEDLITTVGVHDNNAKGYDFLNDVIFSKEDDEIREQAVFWIAQHDNPKVFDLMKKITQKDKSEDVREKAVFGLYIIETDEATDELIDLARNSSRLHIRKQAIFWLGQTASNKALTAIDDAIYNEEETEIQKQAVFALSQLDNDESIPRLIKVAKTHHNPKVRKQAIFWLGQTEDERALDAIIGFLKE